MPFVLLWISQAVCPQTALAEKVGMSSEKKGSEKNQKNATRSDALLDEFFTAVTPTRERAILKQLYIDHDRGTKAICRWLTKENIDSVDDAKLKVLLGGSSTPPNADVTACLLRVVGSGSRTARGAIQRSLASSLQFKKAKALALNPSDSDAESELWEIAAILAKRNQEKDTQDFVASALARLEEKPPFVVAHRLVEAITSIDETPSVTQRVWTAISTRETKPESAVLLRIFFRSAKSPGPFIKAGFLHRDPGVRLAALAHLDEKAAPPPDLLATLARDSWQSVRLAAIQSMVERCSAPKDPTSAASFQSILENDDALSSRKMALRGMVKCEASFDQSMLLDILESRAQPYGLRSEAAKLLKGNLSPALEERLMDVLSTLRAEARYTRYAEKPLSRALIFLGGQQTAKSEGFLRDIATGNDEIAIRSVAIKALSCNAENRRLFDILIKKQDIAIRNAATQARASCSSLKRKQRSQILRKTDFQG